MDVGVIGGRGISGHLEEVVGGGEFSPIVEEVVWVVVFDGGFEFVELGGGVLLHGVAEPRSESREVVGGPRGGVGDA